MAREGQTLRLFLADWELAQLNLTLRILEEVGPLSNLQERLWFFSDEHRCVEFFCASDTRQLLWEWFIPGGLWAFEVHANPACAGSIGPLLTAGNTMGTA